MHVVILAGGLGTRLAEETEIKPKPMVEIGDKPILWHIMRHYLHYGFSDFFIALGYKGDVIKHYFWDYYHLYGNLSFDFLNRKIQGTPLTDEDWQLQLVDTGLATMTGGRIKRLESWLKDDAFMVTYGDGVSNINLKALLDFHKENGKLATITAVRPPARFGGIEFDGNLVRSFTEKPQIGEGWINGGFMVFEPRIFDFIEGDDTVLESQVLETLSREGELSAYRHTDFWQCMDTLRDKRQLDTMWQEGNIQWTI
jgi:glucose-1-phosphate cytidylyltransferase